MVLDVKRLTVQDKKLSRDTTTKLRYITGRGGFSESGLNKYLRTFSDDFKVLANDRNLHRRSVNEQIEIVREFSNEATHLIANSYGDYLWLLSRINAAKSAARVLLLSPLMGRHTARRNMMARKACRSLGLIREKSFPRPGRRASVEFSVRKVSFRMTIGYVELYRST